MGALEQDVRYALRMMRSSPGFTAVAVIALALGIGANAAIFSVVHAVLLRPLPYDRPEQLVRIHETFMPNGWGTVAPANFKDWRDQNQVFAQLSAYRYRSSNLQDAASPERIPTVTVTADMFTTLHAQPMLGRTFTPDEDQEGKPPVVIISEALWRNRFSADPKIVGRSFTIDGTPTTVVGVMPANFHFPPTATNTGIWQPLVMPGKEWQVRNSRYLFVLARLRPGVSIAAAAQQLKQVASQLAHQYPEDEGRGVWLVPLREEVVKIARPALLALMGAVGLVLLIACANVANLLLARAMSRRREVAVRIALGATPGRLIRQLLTESILLAVTSGALGVIVANWAMGLLLLSPSVQQYTRGQVVRFDFTVLVALLGMSVLTGVLFGLAPALQTIGNSAHDDLKEGSSKTVGAGHGRIRNFLVVAEMALALMLLVGAGLMIRTFLALQKTDPGVDTQSVITFQISLPESKYPDAKSVAFYDTLLPRLRSLPGVKEAGATSAIPLLNWGINGEFTIEGRPAVAKGQSPRAELRIISPGYFRAMGVSLLRGRDFNDSDAPKGPTVAMINSALAEAYFKGEDPIGKSVAFDGDSNRYRIVGVVADVRQATLDRLPLAEMYLPYAQAGPWQTMGIVVNANGDPQALTNSLRASVRDIDSGLPIFSVQTMNEVVRESLSSHRLNFGLMAGFALLALVLAGAGIYGVISYLVNQRTREFGLRMALGARPSDVLGLLLRQQLKLFGTGIVIGIAGALAVTRLLSSMLYGVGATDVTTFAAVSILLASVAFLAGLMPARRATQVDPMVALRYE